MFRAAAISRLPKISGTVSEFVKDSPMVQVYNELAERVLAMSEDEEE